MNFNVINLGCKVNSFEAEACAAMMEKKGFTRVDEKEPADISVIFTCAVTNTAAQKSRQMMHRARRRNPDCVVCVAGCYSQVEPEELSDAEILVGTASKKRIPEYIETYLSDHKKIRDIENVRPVPFENLETERFENRTRAYLKIQDGCNQFCSYCIIPYARGAERSMDPDLVIKEAKRIAKTHHEIVLSGIHTGRYGREYGTNLGTMMQRLLDEVPELQRLRISSIEVTELDDSFLRVFAQNPGIARHLHIPLQSGSSSVLKRMNRPYTPQEFYEKITEIRKLVPDVSISTDLITGFPQESEEEFAETVAFLKKCQFSFIHVFPFSLRDGTAASKMPCQIAPEVKKERARVCLDLSIQLYDRYKQSMLGKVVSLNPEEKIDGYWQGHTSEYLEVKVPQDLQRGVFCDIVLKELKDHQLYGEKVQENETE